MICAATIILAAILGYTFYKEFKKAPEMWICHYCNNEVLGLDFCPYCGTKKEEA